MTARSAFVVVAVSALLTACAHTADKEPSMTPDQARVELTKTIQAVLEAAAPGSSPNIDSTGLDDGIPCGGLEGNEFNKIKHGIHAEIMGSPSKPVDPLTAIRKRLRELGYNDAVNDLGDFKLVGFFDSSGSADIKVYPSGRVEVDAETRCLDNPHK